ncbi:MAG TPA: response regulator [Longimicrobiales bacterium]|nr:response regulator [Longimicrobiales bacterium]
MRLLLVEDDKLTAELIKFGLTEDGHETDHVTTGLEALTLARANTYDAMVFDFNLPDTTGIAMTQTLREEGQSTPILILTATVKTDGVLRALDAGANDYLGKPFNIDELLTRIRLLTAK